MNDLRFKIARAMNYIPSNLIYQKKGYGGLSREVAPLAVWIEDEVCVLKDKNLVSEHYERKTDDNRRIEKTTD